MKVYYQTDERNRLLLGREHDYFFVNCRGSPFSAPGLSAYLANLAEKHMSVRIGTTGFRHAIITHFLSLEKSGDEKLSESPATAMKNSRKMQEL